MQFSILLLPLGAEGGARPQLPYSQRLQVRQRKSLWLLIATERDFQHVHGAPRLQAPFTAFDSQESPPGAYQLCFRAEQIAAQGQFSQLRLHSKPTRHLEHSVEVWKEMTQGAERGDKGARPQNAAFSIALFPVPAIHSSLSRSLSFCFHQLQSTDE